MEIYRLAGSLIVLVVAVSLGVGLANASNETLPSDVAIPAMIATWVAVAYCACCLVYRIWRAD